MRNGRSDVTLEEGLECMWLPERTVMSQNPRYRLRTKIEVVGSHITLSGKAPQDAVGFRAISTMIFFFWFCKYLKWKRWVLVCCVNSWHMGGDIHLRSSDLWSGPCLCVFAQRALPIQGGLSWHGQSLGFVTVLVSHPPLWLKCSVSWLNWKGRREGGSGELLFSR